MSRAPYVRPFPLEPALEAAGGAEALARAVGVSSRTVSRWRTKGGLTPLWADRVAIRLHTHPSLLWGPLWWAAA